MAGKPKVKDLYLFKSLKELKEASQVKNQERTSAKTMLAMADDLYEKGRRYLDEGDEERALHLLYRYADSISEAMKKDDYLQDKKNLERLIDKRKFKYAIDAIEVLKISLEKRYQNLDLQGYVAMYPKLCGVEVESNTEDVEDDLEISEVDVEQGNADKDKVPESQEEVSGHGHGIIPFQLKRLLRKKNILIIDCRDHASFIRDHIDHQNCINVPPSCLMKGISAYMIQNCLKQEVPESFMEWQNRNSFEWIILYDEESTNNSRGNELGMIYEALVRWDQGKNELEGKVLVVEGGIKSIVNSYPALLII